MDITVLKMAWSPIMLASLSLIALFAKTMFMISRSCSCVNMAPVLLSNYSFSRLLWHIFPITVYFFKTAHTQPIPEDEITKTLFDVCRMTPPSQNSSHFHQNLQFVLN